MKQKVVIKVSMINGNKTRTKALKIAVGVSGVEMAAVGGNEKDQIEVTGAGIDSVVLTTLLRKNVGSAVLVSVTPLDEKKEEKKPEPTVQQMVWTCSVPPYQICQPMPNTYCQQQYCHDDPTSCAIM